ncbi:hypothetical protein PYCC9005_002802 [Savitreella phatthalungensis]
MWAWRSVVGRPLNLRFASTTASGSGGGAIRVWRPVARTVKWLAAYHLLVDNVLELNLTSGPSLMPTLQCAGDWCLIDKWRHARGKGVAVGDLVVVAKPGLTDVYVLKRVIGMPGDVVLLDPTVSMNEYIKVPEGHVWIVGDNLPHSTDSRHYGPVSMGLIRGRAVAIVYPEFRWIPRGMEELHQAPVARGFVSDTSR